jgi:hypothetical protein
MALPLLRCDKHPEWLPKLRPAEELLRQGQPDGYAALRVKVACETLILSKGIGIVEGGQLAATPRSLFEHRVLVVLPPKELVVSRRTARRVRKAIRTGEPTSYAHVRTFEDLAAMLYDEWMADLPQLQAGVKDLHVYRNTGPLTWESVRPFVGNA